jgi:hypothetical protein
VPSGSGHGGDDCPPHDKLKRSLCDFVGSLLLADYDIHVALTEYNRNVIRWSRL